MKITKTNPFGLFLAKNGFRSAAKLLADRETKDIKFEENVQYIAISTKVLTQSPKAKVIRVSKGVMDSCKLIDIESIRENVDQTNFEFTSLFILLDNDKSGIIKVERTGSDIGFIMVSNLTSKTQNSDGIQSTFNSYSFISKEFYFEKDENKTLSSYEDSVFVIQLLTYLIYGDITEKLLIPKMKSNQSFNAFVNDSKINVTYCDSLWKQRINTEGFKVRGHFRFQPIGEGRSKKKLIWIEDFQKQGYNRKATVELIK